jgi:hypothetical protein
VCKPVALPRLCHEEDYWQMWMLQVSIAIQILSWRLHEAARRSRDAVDKYKLSQLLRVAVVKSFLSLHCL